MKTKDELDLTLDPFNKFESMPVSMLVYSIGRLPDMIRYSLARDSATLADSMVESYGFGCAPMTGGMVSPDGIYEYPEDPKFYPIAKYKTVRGIFYIYSYGIVAILEKGLDPVMYRFD